MNWQPYSASSLPPLTEGFLWSKCRSEPDSERHPSGADTVHRFVAIYGASSVLVWAPMTEAEQRETEEEYRRNGW
jgi:hypothetical protein